MAQKSMDDDFDDIDDLDDFGDVDLSSFGSVVVDIQEPHWEFDTKAFLEALSVVKKVSQMSGRDVIVKSVLFSYSTGKLNIKATDFDVYFETSIECLNIDNVLKESIVVPLSLLVQVIPVLSKRTYLVKVDDQYVFRVSGGDLALEVYSVEASKYEVEGDYKFLATVQVADLRNVVRSFSQFVMGATTPSDRRIIFNSSCAEASNIFALVRYNLGSFADFDLRVKDIHVLSSLLAPCKISDDVLTIYQTDDLKAKRIAIVGDKFRYVFLVSDTTMDPKFSEVLGKEPSGAGILVDLRQLNRFVRLSYELSYAIGKVLLRIEDTELVLTILTKKKKNPEFRLTGSVSGDVVSSNIEIEIPSKMFYLLLSIFATETSVTLHLSSDNMVLSSDAYRGVLILDRS